MDEFFKSIAEAIKKRSTTAFLGTYTLFWLLLHWQGVYVTLFVNEEKIYEKHHLLKNEYIDQYFFGWNNIGDWRFYLGFIAPLALTYVFIWWIPKYVLIRSFAKERDHKLAKQQRVIQDEITIESFKAKLAAQSVKTLEVEKKAVKKEKEIFKLDPEKQLELEYRRFTRHPGFKYFLHVIDSIYVHGGRTKDYWDDNRGTTVRVAMPKEALAVAHSNDLISIDNKTERISLTKKGQYFVSQYPVVSRSFNVVAR